eukprot:Gb_34533 [translate_table: standard]
MLWIPLAKLRIPDKLNVCINGILFLDFDTVGYLEMFSTLVQRKYVVQFQIDVRLICVYWSFFEKPQLSPQIGEIPRSAFQFDFDFERKILAEAEKENQNWSRVALQNASLPRNGESSSLLL